MSDNPYIQYELLKKEIAATSKTPDEYEIRIQALARELGL